MPIKRVTSTHVKEWPNCRVSGNQVVIAWQDRGRRCGSLLATA